MENIEAAMKRIPPHSTEAEQAVLGAMLMNKDAIAMKSTTTLRKNSSPMDWFRLGRCLTAN